MTQPSNKAPESPSPNGLTPEDLGRIAAQAGRSVGKWEYASSNRLAFREGAKYATLYEREQSAQLRAEVESARSELEKLSKFIWDATPPLNRTQIGNTVDSILKLMK